MYERSVLFSSDLNVPECDNKPCERCGKVVGYKKHLVYRNGEKIWEKDRSRRVDCDSSCGKQAAKLCTYHKNCYLETLHELDND